MGMFKRLTGKLPLLAAALIIQTMIKTPKFKILLLPFQVYSLLALFALLICRIIQGHEYNSPLVILLAWSCIISSFFWLIGSVIQAFGGMRQIACINAILAIAVIFMAAHLMPYLAK